MRQLSMDIITKAAKKAGLPDKRISELSTTKNLILPLPYIELEFLPESYLRTGRKLVVTREKGKQVTKKELYETSLEVIANIFGNNKEWLAQFERNFLVAFPRGVNDSQGNWVKIAVEQATFTPISANNSENNTTNNFVKTKTSIRIRFTGRITLEEHKELITNFEIKVSVKA